MTRVLRERMWVYDCCHSERSKRRTAPEMQFSPLRPACPVCGSREITYTCEPKCCFNHVCNDCHASFMLATEKAGAELPPGLRRGLPAAGPADPLAPCVGCDRCQSTAVYELESGVGDATHVCGGCFALLKFGIEDVAQN